MSFASHSAASYTDFAALARLRSEAGRDAGGALDEVAGQFESMFMKMMMKSMREAGFGDPLLGSKQVELYQGMLDDQLSVTLSRNGSLGIAAMLKRQLGPLVANGAGMAGAPATAAAYGGGAGAPAASAAGDSVEERPFTGPRDFIERLRPAAERAAGRLGVPAGLLLAQAGLETGWGRAVPARADGTSSHNLFGIKADGRWAGERVSRTTLEFRDGVARREQASFRAYPSYEASFDDYVDFLKAGTRYAPALGQAGDPDAFMHGLHQAGYATDPDYAGKVLRLWREQVASVTAGGPDHG